MTKNRSQDRDRPDAEVGDAPRPQGKLGAWLRTQREARGVSLREIADSSKISLRYLEALEVDRFEVLPAPVFTRGFLREYARVVGLDADEVVNLYLVAAGEQERERAAVPPEEPRPLTPRPAARGSGGPSALGYGLLLVAAVALFLGVAALLSWWAERRSGTTSDPAPVSPPAAVHEAPAPARPRETAPPASQSAGDTSKSLHVVLEFTQDCWIEFVVDGRRRTSELRTSGEVLTLDAQEFVLLTLGNVPGVRIEVDGKPFALPAAATRVVRDFRIARPPSAPPAGALLPAS